MDVGVVAAGSFTASGASSGSAYSNVGTSVSAKILAVSAMPAIQEKWAEDYSEDWPDEP